MTFEEFRTEILRWALANAIEHKGQASAKSVLRKLLTEKPELRPKARDLAREVERVVGEVNRLSSKEQITRLEELGAPKVPLREERRELPELPDADKYPTIVTRFAPNPNGPLHVGHVRAALLSHEYARRYGGKFILRFEDTNPANALPEIYDLIREDLSWLGIKWDEEYVQSDRLEIYYGYAERLLREGKAYVCTCAVENFRRARDEGEPCPCRRLPTAEHQRRWQSMLGEYGEGKAVVRIKTDLKHPNPAVRDWPALRIVTAPHPRVGERYRVWPLYNFAVTVDDHEIGVTHVIRGKEHVVNEMRQHTLLDHLGWEYPRTIQYGRLTLGDAILSKTRVMRGIESGEFTGYGDPRLGTLVALRRRGILPEAVRRIILDIGPTPVDSALSWRTLFAHNRRLVDARADRYFFVENPVKLIVRGVPELLETRLRLHPSYPDRGERTVPLTREGDILTVHIAREDAAVLRLGHVFRLKDLLNVELKSLGPPLEGNFRGFKLEEVPKIQWVSAGAVEVEVEKPDATRVSGLAEPAVAKLGAGAIVQFERYGFVRVDAVEPKIIAIYGHR